MFFVGFRVAQACPRLRWETLPKSDHWTYICTREIPHGYAMSIGTIKDNIQSFI